MWGNRPLNHLAAAFEHTGGAHVSGEIAPVLRSAQYRQRIEGSPIHILRKLPMQFRQHGFVSTVALFLRALAKQNLDALKVEFFSLRQSLSQPRLRSETKPIHNRARSSNILLMPERMILRHRFAPKRQSKVRSDLLG